MESGTEENLLLMDESNTPPAEEFELTPPRADTIVESLRAFGYDLPTALADIVDNSISAKAKNIWIRFDWDDRNSTISVVDDGVGMTEGLLTEAMRAGSKNPLETRETHDLGRFGLGLKTAAFSQCRRLTVCTKSTPESASCRVWDLDYIAQTTEWRLIKPSSPEVATLAKKHLKTDTGTAVILSKLDRVFSGFTLDETLAESAFLTEIALVEAHLSMVFHKFLSKPRKIRLYINETEVYPWDPFLAGNLATQQLEETNTEFQGERLSIQPYVLPHHSKLSNEQFETANGPKGWTAQQGFYVYRGNRLLVTGDWLGLGFTKDEHTKLARIAVHLPNTTDEAWSIDVKKSKAIPPVQLRRQLKKIAKATRSVASNVYRHRGGQLPRQGGSIDSIWTRTQKHGKIHYTVSRSHPLVKQVLDEYPTLKPVIQELIKLIEETLPTPQIGVDIMESPQAISKPFEHDVNHMRTVLKRAFHSLLESGASSESARTKLMTIEPFCLYPELVETIDHE